MGYKRKRKIYKLVFADPEMDGLEVRARPLPLGKMLRVGELVERGRPSDLTTEEMDELLTLAAKAVVTWNLEEEVCEAHGDEDCETCGPDAPTVAVPVPPTKEGLLGLDDLEFLGHLIAGWMAAVAGVSAPLEDPSPGGDRSLEVSLPMEASSPSLAS